MIICRNDQNIGKRPVFYIKRYAAILNTDTVLFLCFWGSKIFFSVQKASANPGVRLAYVEI